MSEPCKQCEGTGYIIFEMKKRSLGITTLYTPGGKVTCPDCKGTGKAGGK